MLVISIIEAEDFEQVKNGNYEYGVFITNYPEYGWLCSASSPILDEDGSTIGIALVDISMNEIMQEREDFLFTLTIITTVMVIVIMLVSLYFINKTILYPINALSVATGTFVSKRDEDSIFGISEISKLDRRRLSLCSTGTRTRYSL